MLVLVVLYGGMLRKDPFITGDYYHIYNRGIDKRLIFKDTRDYYRSLVLLYFSNSSMSFRLDDILYKQQKTRNEIFSMNKEAPLVSIGAWCLMPNHFHLLVKQEVDGGITQFMKKLGTGYSMYFNKKYERQGALFGGPFKSKCIKNDDNYMRQLFAYIHLNPLDIKFPDWDREIKKSTHAMKKFLENYPYSSYREYIGDNRAEGSILNKLAFPDYFETTRSFKDFVENYLIPIDKISLPQGQSLRK